MRAVFLMFYSLQPHLLRSTRAMPAAFVSRRPVQRSLAGNWKQKRVCRARVGVGLASCAPWLSSRAAWRCLAKAFVKDASTCHPRPSFGKCLPESQAGGFRYPRAGQPRISNRGLIRDVNVVLLQQRRHMISCRQGTDTHSTPPWIAIAI